MLSGGVPAASPAGRREHPPPLCAAPRGGGLLRSPRSPVPWMRWRRAAGRDQLPQPAGQGGPGCRRLPPSRPPFPPRRRFRRGSAGQEWHPAAGDSITGMLPSARPRAAEEGDRRLALPRLGPGAERDTAGATAGLEVGLQPRTPSLGKGL